MNAEVSILLKRVGAEGRLCRKCPLPCPVDSRHVYKHLTGRCIVGFTEDIDQLALWKTNKDVSLLQRARELAEEWGNDAQSDLRKLGLPPEPLWQMIAEGDLRLFLRVLWYCSGNNIYEVLGCLSLLQTEHIAIRYVEQLMKLFMLLNWWSDKALKALRSQDEWEIGFAICAYVSILRLYEASESVCLLKVCTPVFDDNTRLLKAELVAAYYRAQSADVFASALEQLAWQPKQNESAPLVREVRLGINTSGTGRAREHERAEANYIHSEDDRSPLEREIEPQHPELQWLVPKQHDPLKHALEREEVETILNAATGKTRQLLELILQGYKEKEAAEAIGITPNSAYVLLHKLRKKFSKTS